MPAQPGAERLRVQGAGLPSDDISLSEQHQGRDASDVVASGELRLQFRVDFEKPDLGFELGGDALVDWGHRLARPAPLRPEVDQHRDIVALQVRSEALRRGGDRLSGEKSLVAVAAFRLARVFPAWNTVHAVAVGTNDVPGLFAHELISRWCCVRPKSITLQSLRVPDRDRVDRHQPSPGFLAYDHPF